MPKSNSHKDKPGPMDPASSASESSSIAKAMEGTKRLGTLMEQKADQATKAVGASMESFGCAIHEHEPTSGVLHNVGETLAARLEGGGRYLETRGLEGVAEDVTSMIRRNPIPALLVGVGIGFLLARMMKRI